LLHQGGCIADIIRWRDKELAAAKACSELAINDCFVREYLVKRYGTEDLLGWLLDWLSDTNQKEYAELRKNSDFIAVLNKYKVTQ
jgi:hypothetical protein